MGIYFFVISDAFLSPATLVDRTYPPGRYTDDRLLRRLQPSVRRNRDGTDRSGETITAVVSRICGAVQPHSLDAILIFAHGHQNSAESIRDGYTEPTIKLGRGLTKTTASEFSRITYLWRRSYEPDFQTDFRVVVPRIEMHVCYAAEQWNRPVVEALARAARATVFASQVPQMVENLAFEGRVLRFNP
jgi:hypothetical protein